MKERANEVPEFQKMRQILSQGEFVDTDVDDGTIALVVSEDCLLFLGIGSMLGRIKS